MSRRPWSADEIECLRDAYARGSSLREIHAIHNAAGYNRELYSVQGKLSGLGLRMSAKLGLSDAPPEAPQRASSPVHELRRAAEGTMSLEGLQAQLEEAHRENARLSQQLVWAQHSDSPSRTGGLMTIFRSDEHYADLGHLLNCGKQLEEKSLVVAQQYEPDRIVVQSGGDYIAGKGIYPNQDLDMVTTNVDEQCTVAAWNFRRYILRLREAVPKARIKVHMLSGNHDVSHAVSIVPLLHERMRSLMPTDVDVVYDGHRRVANLASSGTYNALILHGNGYSANSPSSPAFVQQTKDTILELRDTYFAGESIRRVIHGHTHWANVGLERVNGLWYDSAGGLQLNKRVKLGMNQRRPGWIVYISPAGSTEILTPMLLVPDDAVLLREMDDTTLASRNRIEVSKCLDEHHAFRVERGDYGEFTGGPSEGRW